MARIRAGALGVAAWLLLVSLLGVVQADSMVSTLPGVSRTLGSGGRLAGMGWFSPHMPRAALGN